MQRDASSPGAGLAVRAVHAQDLLAGRPALGLAELLADNHMAPGGPARWLARRVASVYPVALHAVGASLGGPDPLDLDYLARLRALAEELGACWVSDHVSFSSWHGHQFHDLLPLPCSEEALEHLVPRIHQAQEVLGRAMLLENPSRYLPRIDGELGEAEFLAQLVARTGCGLLIDVNNAYVNEVNLGGSASEFLDLLPVDAIGYVHVAGHTAAGDHLLDTHGEPISEPVWALLARLLARRPELTVVVERDRNLPPLSELLDEVARATRLAGEVIGHAA